MNLQNLTIRPWRKTSVIGLNLSPAAWLTFVYLLLSVSWILGSDQLAENIAGDNSYLLHKIQAVKGLLFVMLSGVVLYSLSRKFYKNLQASFIQNETIQAKYNAVNEVAREGFFDCDLITLKAEMNDRMKFFFPVNSNEVENFWEKYQKRIHPDDICRLLHEFDAIVSSGKTNWLLEYRLMGRDNKYYTVISNIYIMRDEKNNNPIRLIGGIQDVTELRNLQNEYYVERLKNKQRLTESIIKAQENERERWAGELHDNVCQILGVAKLYLSELKLNKENTTDFLDQTDMLVSKALEEIRQLSYNMKPPSFENMTLTESVEMLVSNVRRVKKFEFSFNSNDFKEQRVSDDHKILIYRIIQEQLNNIVKYAEAAEVGARLSIDENNRVRVTVSDNGNGFDPLSVKTGIGLRNIESRIQAHKGRLKIESAPGKGCTLSASFSL